MSVRDHRNRAEGKRFKGRMPSPNEAKLGTRVHDNYEDQFQEDIPEVIRCPECGHYTEAEDLDDYGVCYSCHIS